MSVWWHGLWNDPMSSNPWALGMLVVILAGLFAALEGAYRIKRMFRRRERGKAMNVASPDPIRPDEVRTYDASHQADEQPTVADHGGEAEVTQERPYGLVSTDDGQFYPVEPVADQPAFTPEPPRMAASAAVPRQMVPMLREPCPHCEGTGYVSGINDYLRESIALVGDHGDEIVRRFYTVLFRSAPDLAALFPGNPAEGDLGTDHRGADQRERLLAALIALSDLYDPGNGDKMAKLDTALGAFGRSHAAFVRKDGTIQGATIEEYAAVKDALFQVLITFAGAAWKAEYSAAWSQAYDYAAAVMLAEQFRSGFAAPRFPRA